MYEEIMKEFKIFREQVYAKFAEYDEILRTLISSNSEKIVSTFTDENAVKVIDLYPVWMVGISVAKDSRYQYNGKVYKPITKDGVRNRWLWTLPRMQAAAELGILVETKSTLRMRIYLDKNNFHLVTY